MSREKGRGQFRNRITALCLLMRSLFDQTPVFTRTLAPSLLPLPSGRASLSSLVRVHQQKNTSSFFVIQLGISIHRCQGVKVAVCSDGVSQNNHAKHKRETQSCMFPCSLELRITLQYLPTLVWWNCFIKVFGLFFFTITVKITARVALCRM